MKLRPLEYYFNNKTNIASNCLKQRLFKENLKIRSCEECGITTWNKVLAPLELHHIDGNNKNNKLENLKILCSNCHALTPNFRASNKKQRNGTRIALTEDQYRLAISTSLNTRQACIALGIAPYGGNYVRVRSVQEKFGLEFRNYTDAEIKARSERYGKILEENGQTRTELGTRIVKRKNKYKTKEEAILAICKVKNRPSRDELLSLVWSEPVSSLSKKYSISDSAVRKWASNYKIPVPPVGYWRKHITGKNSECNQIKREMFLKFCI